VWVTETPSRVAASILNERPEQPALTSNGVKA
jgi:hypothetical protein